VGVLRLRHAQELGLPAGYLAIELRVSEQRRAHALLAHLRGLTLGLQALVAHVAVAAGHLERDHHAVAGRDLGDLAAHLLDDAYRLVPQHVALSHERAHHLVEVQVRAADRRRGDANDRVRRLLDLGVRDLVDPNVALSVPSRCLHVSRLPAPGT
jgi:hypothetical protein